MSDSKPAEKKERPPGYNPAFGTQRGKKWKVQHHLVFSRLIQGHCFRQLPCWCSRDFLKARCPGFPNVTLLLRCLSSSLTHSLNPIDIYARSAYELLFRLNKELPNHYDDFDFHLKPISCVRISLCVWVKPFYLFF